MKLLRVKFMPPPRIYGLGLFVAIWFWLTINLLILCFAGIVWTLQLLGYSVIGICRGSFRFGEVTADVADRSDSVRDFFRQIGVIIGRAVYYGPHGGPYGENRMK